ncbi:hypothetical protein N7461_000661 [Penicillium sp. DV-2018c]|nr:hypothetical protein N7461_000661 [Penicillium sp. DV-2018c]
MTALEGTTAETTMDMLDPIARRRLQNRLNQRASRKRKALEAKKQQNIPTKKWTIYTEASHTPNNALVRTNAGPTYQLTQLPTPPRICASSPSCLTPAERRQYLTYLQATVSYMLENPVLSPKLEFCLIQFNLVRAMSINAEILGLTLDLLDEDLASQFNVDGSIMTHLPAGLCPSRKQRQIIHHPWLDLLPILSLRDALLDREGVMDEDEMCGDLYGACVSSEEVGLREMELVGEGMSGYYQVY